MGIAKADRRPAMQTVCVGGGWLFSRQMQNSTRGFSQMNEAVGQAVELLLQGQDLPADVMRQAIGAVMDGDSNDVELASLLTALRMQGESVEAIVGAAEAMSARATAIPTTRTGLLDTCGTGGDRLRTFNISTATAIVAAAAGVPVAKHGNRSVSSSSGSADVLEALGVNINLTPSQVAACIDEIGIGFCFARLLHGAMKHAAPVRQQLGFPTIFNLLGPLTNPAKAEFQLLGANSVATAEKLAKSLCRLGRRRATVVCGAGELDEVALWGETTVFCVENGELTKEAWTASDLGLPECDSSDLRVDSPEESAAMISSIFNGATGPARDIVVANAAAALVTSGHSADLASAVETAAAAIDGGATATLCQRLMEWSNSCGT
jgi:anthranilate phosphoribosyltransferase